MKKNDLFQKLMSLDKELLTKSLIDLSYKSDEAHSLIMRLTSNKEENKKRFISRLESYKDDDRFFYWNKSYEFSLELSELLYDLEALKTTPEEGIELLKMFFQSDEYIISMCDDSSGDIGYVFNNQATDIFHRFSCEYEEKEKLVNILFELLRDNDFGLRDRISENIQDFLPSKFIKELFDRLWEGEKFNHSFLLQDLAKILKDETLFKKVLKRQKNLDKDYFHFKLGEFYLFCEKYDEGITHLEKISNKCFYTTEKNDLLLRAYKATKNHPKEKEISLKKFQTLKNKDNLASYLSFCEEKEASEFIKKEITTILESKKMNNSDVNFLLEMDFINEAEEYILRFKENINGDLYFVLLEWIDIFKKKRKDFIISLLYRKLLDSILKRAKSKTYPHGVKYLRALERLSLKITDWKDIPTHEQYFDSLKTTHKLKRSFWFQYHN